MAAGQTSPQFSPLRVEYLGPDDYGVPWYKLIEPLRFEARLNGGGLTVEVPANYATDFASVPRIFWSRLPHDGPWAKASVVHDYLYQRGGCSRFLADAIFRDAIVGPGPRYRWFHCRARPPTSQADKTQRQRGRAGQGHHFRESASVFTASRHSRGT